MAPYVAILWLPAILVMSSRFYVRPEMLTLVCMAVYLWLLKSAEHRTSRLWWLIPIQVLWVNVQGLFCFGPLLLGCWLVDRWLHSDPTGRRLLIRECVPPAVLVGLACLVNPYGWRGAMYPLALAKTMFVNGAFFRVHIAELASPLSVLETTAYRDIYIWAALVLFLMTAGSFMIPGVRIRFYRLLIFAIFAGLGLTALRNLPQFALISAWVLTRNVADGAIWLKSAERYVPFVRVASLCLVLAAVAMVPGNQLYRLLGSNRTFGLAEPPLWHAHAAATFVSSDGMPRVVLAYHEGQAALLNCYMRNQQQVFADARLEVMGRPAMEEYYHLANDIARRSAGWRERSVTSVLRPPS